MTTTTSTARRRSGGSPVVDSTQASAVSLAAGASRVAARSARAFLTAPVASPDVDPVRASPASARRGSPPTTQRPSRAMPMGTTVWPPRSSAAITEVAEASDTSCSPERPPKTTPTRSRVMTEILLARLRFSLRFPPGAPGAPVGEAAGDVGLEAAVGRAIVLPATERLGQVLLFDAGIGRVVGVLVAGAVADVAHEPGRRVADVQRYRLGRALGHV